MKRKTKQSSNVEQSRKSNKISRQPFYNKNRLLLEIATIVFIIIMFGIALYVYPLLPEEIPTHWNASGQADGFSGRSGVFFIPIVYLIVSILLFVLPMMEVFRNNLSEVYRYYYAFKVFFGLFFLVLFISSLLPNFGYDINVSYVVMWMMGFMFIGLGMILPKLKRNFMFGIRTGWTMSSDEVWNKTHKLGGILSSIIGIITILLLFILRLEIVFFVFIALILSWGLFMILYSYYTYSKIYNKK